MFVSFGVGVRTSTMLACAPSVPASVPTASSWDCAIVTGRSKVTSYSPVAEPFATVGFAASPPVNTSVTPDPHPPPDSASAAPLLPC